MSIQFSCGECQKKMKAPDGTEGKKARCPSCSAITRIPVAVAAAAAVPVAQVARPAAAPVAQMRSPAPATTMDSPPALSDNPFEAPTTTDFSESMKPSHLSRSGAPSWDAKPSFGSFFKTSIEVLTKPTETFKNLIPDAGLGRPLTYGAIVGAITGLMVGVLTLVMVSFIGVAGAENGGPPAGMMMGVALGAMVIAPIMYAVLFPIGALIGAGVIHSLLMLVGAKKYDYQATARSVSYMYFAAWPLSVIMMIPILGMIVAIPVMIWLIVVYIFGLAAVHETTKKRVAIAVLTPALLLLALVILGAILGQTV